MFVAHPINHPHFSEYITELIYEPNKDGWVVVAFDEGNEALYRAYTLARESLVTDPIEDLAPVTDLVEDLAPVTDLVEDLAPVTDLVEDEGTVIDQPLAKKARK